MKNYVLENAPWRGEFTIPIDETDSAGYQSSTGNLKVFAETIREFIDIAKTKNLSVREMQEIFLICSEHVLNCKYD